MKKLFLSLLAAVALATPALAGPYIIVGQAANRLPCDTAAMGGTPCVAAYSTVRALLRAYDGGLYQLTRASDDTTQDIGPVSAGGFANMAAQDSFCAGTTCSITQVYNQVAPSDSTTTQTPTSATVAQDTRLGAPIVIGSITYFGLFNPGWNIPSDPLIGYHTPLNVAGTGIPTGSAAETVYAVFGAAEFSISSSHSCCSDFGNMETSQTDIGPGHMHSVSLTGTPSEGWYYGIGSGTTPWAGQDLENCLTAANYCGTNPNNNSSNTGIPTGAFIDVISKCDCTTNMVFKQGAVGASLSTIFSGALPAGGYAPMHLEGAVGILLGGDLSNSGRGIFFEGAILAGKTSDATDAALHANISVAYSSAKYTIGYHSFQSTGGGANAIWASSVYVPQSGALCSASVNYNAAGSTAQIGFYSDNGGVPDTLLGATAQFTTVAGEDSHPITPCISVTAGTTIWAASLTSGAASLQYRGSPQNNGVGSNTTSLPMASTWPGTNITSAFEVSVTGLVTP